jgi:mRNA interferase HigB
MLGWIRRRVGPTDARDRIDSWSIWQIGFGRPDMRKQTHLDANGAPALTDEELACRVGMNGVCLNSRSQPLNSSQNANYYSCSAGKEPMVRVISKKRLVDFYEQPGMQASKKQLLAWHDIVRKANWRCFADAKQTYGPSLDQVGDCAVFNIRGNDFRLIARFRFQSGRIYVLKIMTHKEYDSNAWKVDCGCFEPPPTVSRPKKSR